MIAGIEAAERVVRRALPHYGADTEGELSFVKYRENWVFRIDQAAGSHAVRVHRLGYRTDAELQEEHDLIAALRRAGLAAVPVLRRTVDGQSFCRVPDDGGDIYQVDMVAWVRGGRPLGDLREAFMGEAEVDLETIRQLGAVMARLHVETSRLGEGRQSIRPSWDCDGLVGERPVWGDPLRAFVEGDPGGEVVARAISALSEELTSYGKTPDRYGPIHADITPDNVLVSDGRMTIIDFDDSGDGYYLFDLATAAFFYLPHPRFYVVVEALFDGYESVRPLADADRSMWRPMLLARGLTYLGWAADRLGDEASDFVFEYLRPVVVELARELTTTATVR